MKVTSANGFQHTKHLLASLPIKSVLEVLTQTVLFDSQVPQRTTSISPALVRKHSPGNGPGLGPRPGAHLIRARYQHTEAKMNSLQLDI